MKKTSKRYLKNGKNSQRQVERFLILAFQCPLAAQKFDHSFVKFNGIHNITAVVEEKTISLNWKLRIDFAPFSFFLVDVSLSVHTTSKMIYFLVCKIALQVQEFGKSSKNLLIFTGQLQRFHA